MDFPQFRTVHRDGRIEPLSGLHWLGLALSIWSIMERARQFGVDFTGTT